MNSAKAGTDFIANSPNFKTSVVGRALSDAPLGFLDIGARGGVHPLVEPIARMVAVLAFEPDVEECRRIVAEMNSSRRFARFEVGPVGLAEKAGSRTLHRLSAPTNDSLREPNGVFVDRYSMDKWRLIGREPVEVTTVDDVVYREGREEPYWGELVKVDVQGTEYEVLSAARRTLTERCLAVVAEVSFCELYVGQKLFSDVESYLRGLGFAFYGFDRLYGRSKKLLDKARYSTRERVIQADAVFLKDPLQWPESAREAFSQRQYCVLFTIALLLGYHDFALELARRAFDSADRRLLEELVREVAEVDLNEVIEEVNDLSNAITDDPSKAHLAVGKFVDRLRHLSDMHDVPYAPRVPPYRSTGPRHAR
jgi:FkbM family methyltransferase